MPFDGQTTPELSEHEEIIIRDTLIQEQRLLDEARRLLPEGSCKEIGELASSLGMKEYELGPDFTRTRGITISANYNTREK